MQRLCGLPCPGPVRGRGRGGWRAAQIHQSQLDSPLRSLQSGFPQAAPASRLPGPKACGLRRRALQEAVPGCHPDCPVTQHAVCPRTPALLLSCTPHLCSVGLQVTAFRGVTSFCWLPRIARLCLLGSPSKVRLCLTCPPTPTHPGLPGSATCRMSLRACVSAAS